MSDAFEARRELGTWFMQMLNEIDQEHVEDEAGINKLKGMISEAFAQWRLETGYGTRFGTSGEDCRSFDQARSTLREYERRSHLLRIELSGDHRLGMPVMLGRAVSRMRLKRQLRVQQAFASRLCVATRDGLGHWHARLED